MKCPKCSYIRKPDDQGPDYECPKCGVIYAKYNAAVDAQRETLEMKVRERAERQQKAANPSTPAPPPIPDNAISAQDLICTTCGSVGYVHETRPGSNLIEVILWLWMIIPGAIYSAWRSSKKSMLCASCGARTIIQVGTPMGRQLLEKTSPGLIVANIPPQKPIATAGQQVTNRLSKVVFYILVFSAVSMFGMLALLMLSR